MSPSLLQCAAVPDGSGNWCMVSVFGPFATGLPIFVTIQVLGGLRKPHVFEPKGNCGLDGIAAGIAYIQEGSHLQ